MLAKDWQPGFESTSCTCILAYTKTRHVGSFTWLMGCSGHILQFSEGFTPTSNCLSSISGTCSGRKLQADLVRLCMLTDTYEAVTPLRDMLKITIDPSTFFLVKLHNSIAQVNNRLASLKQKSCKRCPGLMKG